MNEGKNSRQKVTGTLMLTSLFICAALFLFLVYGGLSDMKEGSGKYFHYSFQSREAIKSLLNRIVPGEPAPVGLSTATLFNAQEQGSVLAAGEPMADKASTAAGQAPDYVASVPPADNLTPLQGSSAVGQEAAPMPPAQKQADTHASIPVP